MVFGDGFRVCRADAETGHECHRRQGRSPRQVADGQRLRREIRVFPPRAQQSLRTTKATPLMRASGESVAGTKWKTLSRRWARSGQLCPPSEDLEDLEQSGKAFKSGEEKAGSIKLIGRADTLPTEGFYD